jgi:hypothetical protein
VKAKTTAAMTTRFNMGYFVVKYQATAYVQKRFAEVFDREYEIAKSYDSYHME